MANKDLEELAIDEHNYPTWTSDMKLSLSSQGLLPILNEQPKNAPPIPDYIKASTLLLLKKTSILISKLSISWKKIHAHCG